MPTFGVSVAIIQANQILLIQRADAPVWGLPGGAIEDGETITQAALRETREETGLDIHVERLVGIYSRPHWRFGGDIGIVFRATPCGGSLITRTDETTDARYFDLQTLPQTLLWHHHQCIVDALHDRTGVVWMQDMRWPFGTDMNMQYLLASGTVTPALVREHLCGHGRPAQEHREIEL